MFFCFFLSLLLVQIPTSLLEAIVPPADLLVEWYLGQNE